MMLMLMVMAMAMAMWTHMSPSSQLSVTDASLPLRA